jgi:hypothetical protein
MTSKKDLNRRQFVQSTSAAVGALAAGAYATPARSAESDQWGDLVGRFVFDGEAPEREKLKVEKEIECCGKFDIRDETLMVADDGGLANVYVYLDTKGAAVCPELEAAIPDKVVLDNRDCIFQPHCMAIWYAKQTFEIVNSDPVAQNVAFDPVLDLSANLVLQVKGKATHKFGRRQTVPTPIKCNYHPWESAYILVRDNPYVAISKSDGTFRIPKLPVGTLKFKVWQERCGYLATPTWAKGRFEMEIKAGENDLETIKIAPEYVAKKE